jgi:hypothetical protein
VKRSVCLAAALAACGCAHHKANPYTYAPPLAPPVYPQPQTAGQPVAFPAPAGAPLAAPPVYAAPGGVLPSPAMPVMPTSAEIPALPDGSCPPCQAGGAMPAGYSAAVQTVPCPPGP